MIHKFTYIVDTINVAAGTITAVYKPEDTRLNAHVAVIPFDPKVDNTKEAIAALIVKNVPSYRWDAEILNVESDLSSVMDLLNTESELVESAKVEDSIIESLESYKEYKKGLVNGYRDRANAEPIEYNGNSFDADFKARNNYYSALLFTGEWPTDKTWRTYDNKGIVIAKSDIQNILDSLTLRDADNHGKAVATKTLIDASADRESVDLIELMVFAKE